MPHCIDIADNCVGTGAHPRYRTDDTESFELADPGDPWHHEDGRLGFDQYCERDELDAQLSSGAYDISAEAIELRCPFSLCGQRSGFGNPNGEYPPRAGSVLRFATNGLRIGRPSDIMNGVDDRVSLPTVEDLALYRHPEKWAGEEIGAGAAIWLDEPSDEFTLNRVNASCCTFGLLSTTAIDAMRVNAFHTARVTFPLYFDSDRNWYNTITNSCFADGDGPCLVQGKHHPWNFQNVLIVRQGRRQTHLPACNIIWRTDNGSCMGGTIEDPGYTFPMSDGHATREDNQINADGMRLEGSGNHISTHFSGASGPEHANLHLRPGSSRNTIQSRFTGTKNGAVDLFIEDGCEDNIVHVSPGMHIIDRGTNTTFIGEDLAATIQD